jgi:hypothetical protein
MLVFIILGSASAAEFRELPVKAYLDKVKGGWAGQMIGVSYGAPTEFKAKGRIYEDPIPWTRKSINNSLKQDDVYVDLSFLEALEKYGLDITYREAGTAFAETKFPLWHANKEGRDNVRKGIMPPDSGSPKYNSHYADIDFQIESDVFGLINPGLPRSSAAICNIFGRVMNSGDGLYGGVFMAAMYTEAFFETDVEKVVRFGLGQIPSWSGYAKAVSDVILWHGENPDDWRATWQRIQEKWAARPSGRCSTDAEGFNIDAKLNGAYVVMGLLYGDGDLAKTLEISTRCGQDSDCNPSSAAGVLCTMFGYSGIPKEYTAGIPDIAGEKFSNVKYTFNDLGPTCLKYARENITRAGGSSKTVDDREVLLIPKQYPVAPKLER